MIPTYAWVLPRPKPDRYPGGFPLHFEGKLLRLLGDPPNVLHQFGGMGEHGLRTDMLRDHPLVGRFGDGVHWTPPDVVADAHHLPFLDSVFDLVISDPPYSSEEAERLYQTPAVRYRDYMAEAVRVCRPGGYVASYHITMMPRPDNTEYHCRILVATRVYHRLRACCVFRKT